MSAVATLLGPVENAAGGERRTRLSPTFRVATLAGAVEAVRVHVARGDDLNACDPAGRTPLMLACSRSHLEVARLLLDSGADWRLLDLSGMSAMTIAVEAGASDLVALLSSLAHTPDCAPHAEREVSSESAEEYCTAQVPDEDEWQPEEESEAPGEDPSIAVSISMVAKALIAQVPKDDSQAWDDIDVELPERAARQITPEAEEQHAKQRLLILRAMREGSVPEAMVDELAVTAGGEPDPVVARVLRTTIEDLGAECDERVELLTPWDDFRVRVEAEATELEEDAVDEAIAHAKSMTSHRFEPMRIFSRSIQSLPLLSPHEEVALGKEMERCIAAAIHALALWSTGLQTVIEGCRKVLDLSMPIRWLRNEPLDLTQAEAGGEADTAVDVLTEPIGEEAPEERQDDDQIIMTAEVADRPDASAPPEDAMRQIASIELRLRELTSIEPFATREVIATLQQLNLSRSFMIELLVKADAANDGLAHGFRTSMAGYLDARESMVNANLKLALFHAKAWLRSGMELSDLTQEANLGLLRVADKFDWRRGYRFSTYATWWVRQAVQRAVADQSRLIRLPTHAHDSLNKAEREARNIEAVTGRAPTLEETADLVGVKAERLAQWMWADQDPLPIHEVDLEACLDPEATDRCWLPDPSEVVELAQIAAVLENALNTLTHKQAHVVRLRFGIGSEEPLTLEQVGERFGLTRERARQIESAALKKLRQPSRMQALSGQGTAARPGPEIEDKQAAGPEGIPELRSAGGRDENNQESDDEALTLESTLKLAQAEGIAVLDERTVGGGLWVHLVNPDGQSQLELEGQLWRQGFAFWPGRGYRL